MVSGSFKARNSTTFAGIKWVNLEPGLPKPSWKLTERGCLSRSTFDRPKTCGISCFHSVILAAAGGTPAVRSIWGKPLKFHPMKRAGKEEGGVLAPDLAD